MTAATVDPVDDTRPLWGIAQYDDGTRRVPWPVSHAEIERGMGGAIPTLAEVGIGAGSRVLWCTLLSEAAHFWPLFIGTMLGGAQFSLADATAPDALRVGMFLRRLQYRAVVGVNDAVLDGFDQLGRPYAEVFGAVSVIGARPGAYERLVAAGLTPHWFVLCGPAVAIAVEPGGPARVDPAEWTLSESGGRIHVTGSLPRATTFKHTPTAIRGSLVDDHSFFPETGDNS
jgi:hypothetical protein